jgi:membrane protease YdiL (CAAX protease family)
MHGSSRARGPSPVPLRPLGALFALAGAELVSQVGAPAVALVIDVGVLFASLDHAAHRRRAERSLAIAVAVIALERPLSLAVPSLGFGVADAYLLLSIPTTIAVVLAMRTAGYSGRDIGLVADATVGRMAIVLVPIGLIVGIAIELVARPLPIFGEVTGTSLGPVIVTALVATGLVEELLYRGLLQHAAMRRLGPANGVVYASALYTSLAWTAWTASTPNGIVVVFLTALALGTMTRLTGSVIPAVATHASLNVGLLLVGPLVTGTSSVN